MEYTDKEEEQTPDLIAKHEYIITSFNKVQTALSDERTQSLEDRRFASIAGAMYEGDLSKYYENKPKIEINKIQLQLKRINNDFMNNNITVNYKSKTGKDEQTAELLDGLYRSDELDSNADEAYNNAFKEAASGGFGAYRFKAIYEDDLDDDNDFQRIAIEPITDADSTVFFNLGAKRQDKKDAKQCWVLIPIPKADFEMEYGEYEVPTTVNKQVSQKEFDWCSSDMIYIAEYYEVEFIPHTVKIYENALKEKEKIILEDYEDDDLIDKVETLIATGFKLVKEKKVKKKKIHKYIVSGNKILEDCKHIAGSEIPIVPIYAERWFIDGVERCAGLVRYLKDAQRIKNIQMSTLTEIASLFKYEKPIVTPEQVKGLEHFWRDDNIENYPYLPINTTTNEEGQEIISGPLGYTKPPSVPPALVALMGQSDADINELLSRNPALDALNSQMSGDAIGKLIDNQDVQNSIYQANFNTGLKRGGEIYMSMARELYVEEDREIKILDKMGESRNETINQMSMDDNNVVAFTKDMSKANFDVFPDVGSSTKTKREATVKRLAEAIQGTVDQESVAILSMMMIMNMDGEGLDDVRPFFRNKLLRMGAVEPTAEEQEQLASEAQNAEPTAEQKYLEAEAQKAEAEAKESNADTLKTLADTEKSQAQTMEILEGIDKDKREQLVGILERMGQSQVIPAVSAPTAVNETGEIN